jgi:hypothetical protein
VNVASGGIIGHGCSIEFDWSWMKDDASRKLKKEPLLVKTQEKAPERCASTILIFVLD